VIAVRTLLERIWYEIISGEYVDVLSPVRRPRSKLLRRESQSNTTILDKDELIRAVGLAASKLRVKRSTADAGLVLVLFDAETDCPKDLVPKMAESLSATAATVDCAIVFANVAFETWFVAAARSLREHLSLRLPDDDITDPERRRCSKKWIEDRFVGPKYSETVDQVRLTAKMDLRLCRERSPSFDKLCRELELRGGHTINDQRVRRERPMP
jgi:hypothetical protein